MRILRNYILRECIVPFILALSVLTCVFLLGNLIQLTNLVINKGVSLSTIGRLFLLYLPLLLGYTLPIACLVSVILCFSRFSADNEILAMRASGVHVTRLLWPIAMLGLIISLFCIILNERIIPYAHAEQHRVLKTLGIENPTALLEAGVFIKAFDDQILFIHKIDDNKLFNITIYQPQPDGPTQTIIARQGEFSPDPNGKSIKLKLMDGTSDRPDPNNPNTFYKVNFEKFFMTLDLSKEDRKIDKKPKGMNFNELREEISKLERLLVDTAKLRTEYWRKITWSFSSFIFVLLGFPIAVITHRREKSANVVLAILCAAAYYLLALACEGLSIKNILPAQIIMWVPNVLTFLIAVYLNIKCAS